MSVKNHQSGIEIVSYNKGWETAFLSLESVLKDKLDNLILCVEHVGSTSVKGLSAKPILDIDIVIKDYAVFPVVITELEALGYYHQENWSFKGREAFGRKDLLVPRNKENTKWMEHHLYVCNSESKELARHLAFRNYLRTNPEEVVAYDQLKRKLANTAEDRAAYTDGKTKFISEILEKVMK